MNIEKNKLLNTVTSLYHLFAEQVIKTPDAIAIKDGEIIMSYKSLHNNVENLSRFLTNNYLKYSQKQSFIGICMNNSIEMLVAIFAILKSGAAYVPIDPKYPDERIQYIINDINLECILTNDERIYSRFSTNSKFIVLADNMFLNAPDVNSNTQDFNIAYVIYTSGSTGDPKGVMVTHKNVINYAEWVKNYLGIKQADKVDFSSSISFDLTVTVTIVPLLYGATVVLCDSKIKTCPINYLGYLVREGISIIKITPSYFNLLCDFIPDNFDLSRLQSIILGGENLSNTHVKKWLTQYNHHKIINEYGPTETTVGAMQATISLDNVNQYGFIPLGQPCKNAEIFVLRNDNSLTSVGEIGEIYIAGDVVTAGYSNRPEMTKQRFMNASSFVELNCRYGNILYRTGDLARVHDNQVLEYIGRIDAQVKINGYRIELGEVENALMSYEVINMAAVVVDTISGNSILVAYYIPKNGLNVSENEVKIFLSAKLPTYMVPHVFVRLKSFELTINGKLDKTKLPDFRNNYLSYDKPDNLTSKGNDVSCIIADVWAEVMAMPCVSTSANFSVMGANSVIIAKFCQRLVSVGINVKITDCFQYNTIELLSNFVRNRYQTILHLNKRSARSASQLNLKRMSSKLKISGKTL
jgi:amino acid adenylation domain-containing protein